jgi:hypothetical protein
MRKKRGRGILGSLRASPQRHTSGGGRGEGAGSPFPSLWNSGQDKHGGEAFSSECAHQPLHPG